MSRLAFWASVAFKKLRINGFKFNLKMATFKSYSYNKFQNKSNFYQPPGPTQIQYIVEIYGLNKVY